jgi:hypothetical protein
LLTSRRVGWATAEEWQGSFEPLQQTLRSEQCDARRRQLDRQRQTVEAATDCSHRRGGGLRQDKVGDGRLCPFHKQPNCGQCRDSRQALILPLDGRSQRRDSEAVFTPQPEGRATRHQERQARTARKQLAETRGRALHLFEIVEDQQHLPVAQVLQ